MSFNTADFEVVHKKLEHQRVRMLSKKTVKRHVYNVCLLHLGYFTVKGFTENRGKEDIRFRKIGCILVGNCYEPVVWRHDRKTWHHCRNEDLPMIPRYFVDSDAVRKDMRSIGDLAAGRLMRDGYDNPREACKHFASMMRRREKKIEQLMMQLEREQLALDKQKLFWDCGKTRRVWYEDYDARKTR